MVKLSDVCDVRDGTHDSPKYVEYGYPLVTSKNIKDGQLDLSIVNFITEEDYNKINERSKVDVGDIIMPMIGTIGNPYLVEEFCDFAIKNVALIKCDNIKVINKFVWYFLQSNAFERYVDTKNKGGTQKFLSLGDIRAIELPEVSIDKQKHIVEILTRVDGIVAKRKQQLQKLDELVKARFVEMFGTVSDNKFKFGVVCLQDVSAPIKDGTHQTPTYTTDEINGYKFLSSKDVTKGKIDWSNVKYIPRELHEELYSKIKPEKGDILLAKNGTTGISAIVDKDIVFDIYVSLALIKPININSTYLWAAINSFETKKQFDSSLKGIGVPNLHLGEIKKAKILHPPLELQKQFADFVEEIDKSKLDVQKSLDKLETLKKALMQKYFG